MAHVQIDGYDIKKKIGFGGMSTVWLARQRSLDRFVAIKMLHERLAADAEDVARFEVEARIAASLKHIGIVQVLDAGVADGVFYIVMEHVDGYTVGDWLRRKTRICEAETLDVAECVADALGYAWKYRQLVHCDIKPDNVMVDADGTVKVTDLGLARTLHQMHDHLPQHEVMGTPAYISPEQAMGAKSLDLRADIYSLGAMIYHLVGGRMLFHTRSEEEMLDQQVNGTDVDVCEHNPEVSAPLCFLLERMLCKDPEGRHSSWGAVLADLQRVREGKMPHGKPLREGRSTMRRSAGRPRVAPSKPVIRVHHSELAKQISRYGRKLRTSQR